MHPHQTRCCRNFSENHNVEFTTEAQRTQRRECKLHNPFDNRIRTGSSQFACWPFECLCVSAVNKRGELPWNVHLYSASIWMESSPISTGACGRLRRNGWVFS